MSDPRVLTLTPFYRKSHFHDQLPDREAAARASKQASERTNERTNTGEFVLPDFLRRRRRQRRRIYI